MKDLLSLVLHLDDKSWAEVVVRYILNTFDFKFFLSGNQLFHMMTIQVDYQEFARDILKIIPSVDFTKNFTLRELMTILLHGRHMEIKRSIVSKLLVVLKSKSAQTCTFDDLLSMVSSQNGPSFKQAIVNLIRDYSEKATRFTLHDVISMNKDAKLEEFERAIELLIVENNVIYKDAAGMTLLHMACKNLFALTNKYGQDTIRKAIEQMAKFKTAADPDMNLNTPLHYVCQQSACKCDKFMQFMVVVVNLLLPSYDNKSLNMKNWEGWSALHHCARWNHKEIIEILIANKAFTFSPSDFEKLEKLTPWGIFVKHHNDKETVDELKLAGEKGGGG